MTLWMGVLALASLPTVAIGLFVIWHIVRPQRAPADTSNRINKFVPVFPWLARDEYDTVSNPHDPS